MATTSRAEKRSKRLKHNEEESLMIGDDMIPFDVDEIREHIICPLCLGVYREPYTTIKCFHTFCKSCLMVSLHANYFDSKTFNVCPAEGCNEYFGKDSDISKLAIADRTLQTVIDKVLFPDLIQKDKEDEERYYQRLGIGKKETAKKPQNVSARGSSNAAPRRLQIIFRLDPLGTAPALSRPIIETDGKIRVRQLKKYIAMQLDVREPIAIFCGDVPLGDELSTTFVKRSVWMETEGIMTLTYRICSA